MTGLYSFLENFITTSGDQFREVNFNNQWVCDTNGDWTEMTSTKFSIDATAQAGARLDYGGGVDESKFYLKNCGFFNDNEVPNTVFTRPSKNVEPNIVFFFK